MNSEDIEKLKEAAFAAVELLKKTPHNGPHYNTEKAEIIAAIEAFKPKSEPVECWANLHKDGSRNYHSTEEGAQSVGDLHGLMIRRAVHLREVAPVEFERWKVGEIGQWVGVAQANGRLIATAPTPNCKLIADAHNEAMQRVTGTEGK